MSNSLKRSPNNKLVRQGPPVLFMDKNGYHYLAHVVTNRLSGRTRIEYYNLDRPAPPYNPNSLKQFFKPASPKRKSPPKRKNSPKRKSPSPPKRKSPSPPKMNKFVMPNFPGL
jgi:hypothetical protein